MNGRPESARYVLLKTPAVVEEPIELQSARPSAGKEHMPSSINSVRIDQASSVRTACLIALALSYGIALAAIAASIYIYTLNDGAGYNLYGRTWSVLTSITPGSRIVLDLVLSAVVTVCTEAMGYIHTVALRWALLREARLHYSSNLRLLRAARWSWPNSRWANALSAFALVLSYAGASQTLVPSFYDGYPAPPRHGASVNGPALLCLGVGLLIQAVPCTACWWKDGNRFPTWSSNALAVTLSCRREEPDTFRHRKGRCLTSAFDALHCHNHETASTARLRQPSVRATDPDVRHTARFVWFTFGAALAWAVVVASLVGTLSKEHETQVANGYFPEIDLLGASIADYFIFLLIVAVFQSFATMGLHAVELLVSRSRDEACWRQIYRSSTATDGSRMDERSSSAKPKKYNSITAALTSWQSLNLYVLKPVVHWLFGNSLTSTDDQGTATGYMNYRFLFPLVAATLVLAMFTTILARHQPRGVVPSTWGHIQTLVDLIDDWGEAEVEKLCWGDKGFNEDGTRHAGTATSLAKVGAIVMDVEYR